MNGNISCCFPLYAQIYESKVLIKAFYFAALVLPEGDGGSIKGGKSMTKEEISSAYGVGLHTVERFRNNALVTPKRLEDGSWVYYEADGEKLQRLLLLEKMGFTENNFVMLRGKERTLKALLQRWFDGLEDGCLGKEICRELLDEEADLESFDAKRYLEQLDAEGMESAFLFKPSFRNQVYRPWRRFFARMLDAFIYGLVWDLFLGYFCHVNLTDIGFGLSVVSWVITMVMMLFIEPLLLNRFGTTFGKWVFGLRVEKADGTRLSYAEGMNRTWFMIGKGEGYYIPIYHLVRLYKSYKVCKAEEIQPWDDGLSYTIKDTKGYRVVACIVLVVIFIFISTIMIQYQQLPPNRGNITLEEFAENYNYFCKYLDVGEGAYMDENGQLVDKPSNGAISVLGDEPPSFEYTIEDGYLTGVSYVHEVENEAVWREVENTEKSLLALAFGCTDEAVGLFKNNGAWIIQDILCEDDFNFTVGHCRYMGNVEQRGYEIDYLIPKEGEERVYYKMSFSITKKK